jgi:predicted amidohydrolase
VKVAAYQAPLLPSGSLAAVALIRRRVNWCEAQGVKILCCPEAILGGLADYAAHPNEIAIDVESGQLAAILRPLASETVTTILGFTEKSGNRLYNSAAIFHKGEVGGIYRKLYPAIRKSVYQAGHEMPVFRVGGLTFGMIICNDSNYSEPARIMTAKGATVVFVPTNNGLPLDRADVVAEARKTDVALALANSVTIIRADVAGRTAELVSYGSSEIVDRRGVVRQSAQPLHEDLLVAELEIARC